jgi:hypothetical protein
VAQSKDLPKGKLGKSLRAALLTLFSTFNGGDTTVYQKVLTQFERPTFDLLAFEKTVFECVKKTAEQQYPMLGYSATNTNVGNLLGEKNEEFTFGSEDKVKHFFSGDFKLNVSKHLRQRTGPESREQDVLFFPSEAVTPNKKFCRNIMVTRQASSYTCPEVYYDPLDAVRGAVCFGETGTGAKSALDSFLNIESLLQRSYPLAHEFPVLHILASVSAVVIVAGKMSDMTQQFPPEILQKTFTGSVLLASGRLGIFTTSPHVIRLLRDASNTESLNRTKIAELEKGKAELEKGTAVAEATMKILGSLMTLEQRNQLV